MHPVLDIFGLRLQTFGLAFAGAFLVAGAMIRRRLRERGETADWAYELVFAALLGGLVGARAYYLLQHYGEVRSDLLGAAFSGSGLVWYGGLIGGVLAVAAWAWRRRYRALGLVDLCAPALAAGYAIGRIGCQLSGDGDYGKASHLPWAMGYPHGTVPTAPGVRVHPTPVYETLAMGLVAVWLWNRRDRHSPGVLFALYLVAAGLERFLVEFVRRNGDVALGLTAAQLESAAMVLVGGAALAVARMRRGSARPRVAAART